MYVNTAYFGPHVCKEGRLWAIWSARDIYDGFWSLIMVSEA